MTTALSRQYKPEGKMTVLVVDDDAGVRNSLRVSLESEGIEVEVAAGPEDATRAISRSQFDAVVTDLSMPGDGEHVLDQVRLLRPDMPVIVVTGELSEARLRSLRRRAHALLTKPFRPEHLVRLLHEVKKAPRTTSAERPIAKPRRKK